MELLTAFLALIQTFAPSFGGTGIQQLQQWRAESGRVELISQTAGIRVASLASLDCIGTDSDGDFQAGICTGGGGGGTTFSTTSADYWKSQRNFFSTTSADYFKSVNNYFSTTSADYWKGQSNFFSTTSASYFSSLGLAFSTTSANHWKSLNNFFSTTSASHFTALGLAFSTTSANYWETQQAARGITAYDAFTHPQSGTSATTSGLIVSASSSIPFLDTVNSTSTNSTTTRSYISSLLSFGGVIGNSWDDFCTAITGSSGLCDGNDASGAGGANDFNFSTTFNAVSAATTSPVWFQGAMYASSTIHVKGNKLSTHNAGFFDIQRNGPDFTLARIVAPTASPYEATIATVVDCDTPAIGTNERFVDFYSENYGDSKQSGIRAAYSGNCPAVPFVVGHWQTAGLKDAGNKLIILPSGSVGIMQATSSVNTATMLHIASTSATNLLKVDTTPGTNKFLVTASQITQTVLSVFNAGITAVGTLDFSGATVKEHTYPKFTWPGTATTTTATTTVPMGQAMTAETFNFSTCKVTSGTSGYRYSDGTNHMNYVPASTTRSRYTISTNNTFVADEPREIQVGPLTNAQITCGQDITVN